LRVRKRATPLAIALTNLHLQFKATRSRQGVVNHIRSVGHACECSR
jgi:hypothetical protein